MVSTIYNPNMSRAGFLKLLAAGAVTAGTGGFLATAARAARKMGTRAIPSTGERLPMVGVGTSRTFDVRLGSESRARLHEVLKVMADAGGTVIDSSPMYGAAERVSGELLADLGARDKYFIATKVWTSGREAGITQMKRSLALFKTDKIELMQVHNLVDWRTQLKTVQQWKAEGIFKYVGVTHYTSGAFDQLASILRREKVDFLQIPYSITDREAERVLFPLCQERGVALITHRNFGGGYFFRRLRGTKLPGWAADYDITSWAQYLLKFVLAHPANTCVIPGTSKVRHMLDNVQAGMGRMPDAKARERMAAYVKDL